MNDTTQKISDELNEKRCLAHEIIMELFHARQAGQIQLLLMACVLADKQLDPENHSKRMRELQIGNP